MVLLIGQSSEPQSGHQVVVQATAGRPTAGLSLSQGYVGLGIGLVVLVGAVLRFLPVPYGLPFFYHADETHLIFNFGKFLEGMARGSFSMDTSTFYYPLAVLYGAYFVLGRLTGPFSSLDDFKMAFILEDPNLHLLGRVVAASFSVATLLLTYALGRRIYGRQAGMIALMLMAVSLIDISSSHWLKLDSTVAFMTLLSVLAMLRITDQPGFRVSGFAGVAVGLAMATRLDAFVLLPLLALAHALPPAGQQRWPGWGALFNRRLFASLGVASVTYLLVSFRLIEFVSRDVLGHAPIFKTREVAASVIEYFLVGQVAVSVSHNVRFYLVAAMLGTFGVVLTGLVFIGAIRALISRRREEVIILAFLALSLAPLLTFSAYGTHYFLVLVPFLMILAAEAIRMVANWVGSGFPLGATAVLVACALAQPAFYCVSYVTYLRDNRDTRERAREWIYQHIPLGERIAVQKYYELPRSLPALHETREQLEKKLAIVRSDGRSSGLVFEARLANYPQDTYEIVNLSIEPHWSAPGAYLENAYAYDQLVAHDVKYVITSGRNNPLPINEDGSPVGILIADRYLDQNALRRYEAFMRTLRERNLLVAEFVPRNPRIALQTDSPIDPTIRIYRLT